MPYASQAQSRFVHWQANEGTPWAKKFVRDAQHGAGSVKALPARTSPLAQAKQRLKARVT